MGFKSFPKWPKPDGPTDERKNRSIPKKNVQAQGAVPQVQIRISDTDPGIPPFFAQAMQRIRAPWMGTQLFLGLSGDIAQIFQDGH